MNQATLTMNGGVIDPQLQNRLDLAKRASSLSECENFIPQAYGGAMKRPGTKYLYDVAEVSSPANSTRTNDLIQHFRGSDGKRYILHFSPTLFRAYDIATNSTHSAALTWPITTDIMPTVRMNCLNDVIILHSSNFAPVVLTYRGATNWVFSALPWKSQPSREPIVSEDQQIIIEPSSTPTSYVAINGTTTFTAGNIRSNSNVTYTCTTNHTAQVTTTPGTGATWRNFWRVTTFAAGDSIRLISHYPTATAWSSASVQYLPGNIVSRSGNYYRAFMAHISSIGNDPLTAPSTWGNANVFPTNTHSSSGGDWIPSSNYRLTQKRDSTELQLELRAIDGNHNKFTNPIVIDGTYDFQTFGTWSGIFTIQRSTNNGSTWTDVISYESNGDRNVSAAFTEDTPVLVRIGFTEDAGTTGGGQQRAVLSPRSANVTGTAVVTAPISSQVYVAQALSPLSAGIVSTYAPSAFSKATGYPSASIFYHNRLVFAGTASDPTTVWASQIGDYYQFLEGTADSDAYRRVLTPSELSPILWMAAGRRLFVGLEMAEWVIGTEDNDAVITPGNFIAREYSSYGSSNAVAPLHIADSHLFCQRHGNRIREFGYDADRETYDAADLTRLVNHLFTGVTVKSWAWQAAREPTLWCVLSDGKLLSLSYNRAENYFAWAKHTTTGGDFLSVAISPNAADDDQIFFLVKRGSVYVLETIPPNASATNAAESTEWFLDCQRTIAATNGNAIAPSAPHSASCFYRRSNLPNHSELLAHGANATYTGNYIGGFVVNAELQTLPLEAETSTGSSLGRKKRVHKARAYVANTTKISVAHYPDQFALMSADGVTSTPTNYTGWMAQNVNLTGLMPALTFSHTSPHHCYLQTIVAEFEITQS